MSIEDLTQRVAALEARLDMQATLRAAGDRDLADVTQTIRATHHLVQALAITQSEHTQKLERIWDLLTTLADNAVAHERRLAALEGRLDRMEGDLTEIKQGQALIIEMLNRLQG